MFFLLTRRLCLAGLATLCLSGLAHALDAPKGKVILSVVGTDGNVQPAGRVDFDMAMLAALPQHSFTTRTPWYEGARKFTGPLLRDVLAAAGAQGTSLKAVGLNNFKVEIPAADAQQFAVIVARLLDDKPMPIREKGPLFIVYPFDTRTELQSARYYTRSAWQLRTLEIK